MQLRNLVLSNLNLSQFGVMSPFLTEVHLAAGQALYEPGDDVEAIYFPSDAVLSIVAVMRDGRSVEAATVGNESVVGVINALAGAPVHSRTFAQIGGSALKLPATRLRTLVGESPSLLKILLMHVQDSIAQAEQSVACNALHTASERLARWLLLSQDRVGSPMIPLTQEYLAVMLGVQRTTVTEVAKVLKAAGVISYRRGRIEITDRLALERASCECYVAPRRMAHTPPHLVSITHD
jgi:CRP-like cAMP-binding protein